MKAHRRATVVLASLPVLLPAFLLAGCDMFGGNESGGGGDSATSSDVLEGSISDAMIPTDTLTSQPPLAPLQPGETVATGDAPEGDAAADGEGEDAAVAQDAPATPAPEPAAE